LLLFQVVVFPFNTFGCLKERPNTVEPRADSSTVSLTLYDDKDDVIAVTNSTKPIRLNLPIKIKMSAVDKPMQVQAIMSDTNENQDLFYHSIEITNQAGALNVEIVPLQYGVQLAVYIRYDDFPDIDTGEWDAFGVVPRKMALVG
jgi:hypothetical protein